MTTEQLLRGIGFGDADILEYKSYDALYRDAVSPYVTAFYDEKKPLPDVLKALDGLATPAFHRFTAHLMFAVGCALRTHDAYRAEGIPDSVYFDTMRDITVKLGECRAVHGVFGNAVVFWYEGFFRLTRFGVGRLEFDVKTHKGAEIRLGDDLLREGDFCLDCHIPSGSPLYHELCLDAYDRAHEFFADRVNGVLPIVCHSWLLFPPYLSILGKNAADFARDYHIARVNETENFPDGWRIFDTEDLSDIDALPADTGLRRRFIEYMKSGKKYGVALGVIFHRLKK